MAKHFKIMIVAGEPSGDAHAAKLVKAMIESVPQATFDFFGCAGEKMRDAGVEPVVLADDLAIMGIPEIAKALPGFIRAFRKLTNAASERRPDIVILVDFPEFNLKLAKSLKKRGFKIVYYISPQLWGWRKYRRRTIREHVDLLLTILPFEAYWYSDRGIENVEYVGSPLVNEVTPNISRSDFRARHSLDEEGPLIALLPGSRHKEITRILPPMLEAASAMVDLDQRLQFVIALSSTRSRSEVEHAIAAAKLTGTKFLDHIRVVKDETYDALNASDAAAVASGTATLETGMIGTPMAIVYKTSSFNYKMIRPLIKIDHFGLINLIAGERIVNEMIQDEFTPENLKNELVRLLKPETNSKIRAKLKAAVAKLGKGGASDRAAASVLRVLEAG